MSVPFFLSQDAHQLNFSKEKCKNLLKCPNWTKA